jgi:death-on-curing protein
LTHFVELGDYCEVAGEILGLDPERVAELPNIGLADSALAAPRAGFGDHEAFPTLLEKAAILIERLARNHPLPDGNKRAAFLSGWLFMELNGRPFDGEDPGTDVPMMERIATGETTQDGIIAWLERRITAS